MSDELPNGRLFELLLWALKRRCRFRVMGTSMAPLLQPEDEVLVNPRAYHKQRPQVGDIVVTQHPYQDLRLIKRVVFILADGRLCLQGDNHCASTDSRVFGPITLDFVLGQVTSRFP